MATRRKCHVHHSSRDNFKIDKNHFLSNCLNYANTGEIHSFSINETDFVPIQLMSEAATQIDTKIQQRSLVE